MLSAQLSSPQPKSHLSLYLGFNSLLLPSFVFPPFITRRIVLLHRLIEAVTNDICFDGRGERVMHWAWQPSSAQLSSNQSEEKKKSKEERQSVWWHQRNCRTFFIRGRSLFIFLKHQSFHDDGPQKYCSMQTCFIYFFSTSLRSGIKGTISVKLLYFLKNVL